MLEKDPRTISEEYKNLPPEQKAMVKLEITLTRFFKDFDRSIGRWERMVYPMMFVLAMLGFSGFYLIYHITSDMRAISEHVDPHMRTNLGAISAHMGEISRDIRVMTTQVSDMAEKMNHMDKNVGQMAVSLAQVQQRMDVMTLRVTEMNQAMRAMTVNTGVMTRDINEMSRPMKVFPW